MNAVLETVETTGGKAGGISEASGTTDGTTDVKAEETSEASETTDVKVEGTSGASETTEGAANKEAIETTEETEVAVNVLPTVGNEVVEPSTTMIGPVPVATT